MDQCPAAEAPARCDDDDPLRPAHLQSPQTREHPTHELSTHSGAGQASEVQVAEERYARTNHTHEKNGCARSELQKNEILHGQ
jgi:hypothetical protein